MTARRHHYIPRCYLKGFCKGNKNPKIQVIDLKRGREYRTGTINIALENNFHSIDVPGLASDAIEQDFAVFESDLSDSLTRIRDGRSINNRDDFAHVLMLIAILSCKNPQSRESFRQFHAEVANMVIETALETPARWEAFKRGQDRVNQEDDRPEATYEEMKAFLDRREYEISLSTTYHLGMELQLISTVYELLKKRKWALFKCGLGSSGFTTSDNPAVLMWSKPEMRGGLHPPGHALAETQIIFPLSSELCIIGSFEMKDGAYDVNDSFVTQVNTVLAHHSMGQIYARDNQFKVLSPSGRKTITGAQMLSEVKASKR